MNHLSERGATFGAFSAGVDLHPAGVPVWAHSPSGPGRVATNATARAAAGRSESPLGERCHFRSVFSRGRSSPSRHPSVGPLSEWARTSLNQRHGPSRSRRSESPLGERCHIRSVFRIGRSSPSRHPSVESFRKPPTNHTSLKRLNDRGRPPGARFRQCRLELGGSLSARSINKWGHANFL